MSFKSFLLTSVMFIAFQLPSYSVEKETFHRKFLEHLGSYSKQLYEYDPQSFDEEIFENVYKVNLTYCQLRNENYDEKYLIPEMSKLVLEKLLVDYDFTNPVDRQSAIVMVDTFNSALIASIDTCS